MVIDNLELFAAEEWYSAVYRDFDGTPYDIVIVKSHMQDIGYEHRELANILVDDEVPDPGGLWSRVSQEVDLVDLPDRKSYEPASTTYSRGDAE